MTLRAKDITDLIAASLYQKNTYTAAKNAESKFADAEERFKEARERLRILLWSDFAEHLNRYREIPQEFYQAFIRNRYHEAGTSKKDRISIPFSPKNLSLEIIIVAAESHSAIGRLVSGSKPVDVSRKFTDFVRKYAPFRVSVSRFFDDSRHDSFYGSPNEYQK